MCFLGSSVRSVRSAVQSYSTIVHSDVNDIDAIPRSNVTNIVDDKPDIEDIMTHKCDVVVVNGYDTITSHKLSFEEMLVYSSRRTCIHDHELFDDIESGIGYITTHFIHDPYRNVWHHRKHVEFDVMTDHTIMNYANYVNMIKNGINGIVYPSDIDMYHNVFDFNPDMYTDYESILTHYPNTNFNLTVRYDLDFGNVYTYYQYIMNMLKKEASESNVKNIMLSGDEPTLYDMTFELMHDPDSSVTENEITRIIDGTFDQTPSYSLYIGDNFIDNLELRRKVF